MSAMVQQITQGLLDLGATVALTGMIATLWFGKEVIDGYGEENSGVQLCTYGFTEIGYDDAKEDYDKKELHGVSTAVTVLFLLGMYVIALVGLMLFRQSKGDDGRNAEVLAGQISKTLLVDIGFLHVVIALALAVHAAMTSYCTVGISANSDAFFSPASANQLRQGNMTNVGEDGRRVWSDAFYGTGDGDYSVTSPTYSQKFFFMINAFENDVVEYMAGFLFATLFVSSLYRVGTRYKDETRREQQRVSSFLMTFARFALIVAAFWVVKDDSFDEVAKFTTVNSEYTANATVYEQARQGTGETIRVFDTKSFYAINSGRCLASMMSGGDKPRDKFKDFLSKVEAIKLVKDIEFVCRNDTETVVSTGLLTTAHHAGTAIHDYCDPTARGFGGSHPGHSILTMNVTGIEVNEEFRGFLASAIAFVTLATVVKMGYATCSMNENIEKRFRSSRQVLYSLESVFDAYSDFACCIIILSLMMSTVMWSCQLYTFETDGDHEGTHIQFLFTMCYIFIVFSLCDTYATFTGRFPGRDLYLGITNKGTQLGMSSYF